MNFNKGNKIFLLISWSFELEYFCNISGTNQNPETYDALLRVWHFENKHQM